MRPVHGDAAPGFEGAGDEFRRNFQQRGELGAACAVYHRGEKVVDLWGGYSDRARTRPWDQDMLVVVYSTSKGMAATTVALARSRGLLDYDERVSSYWPEFAANGKGEITVRQLLAHEAGLAGVDAPLTPAVLADPDAVAAAIAPQRPAWTPGTRHGYHALSLGFYESELIRRVDPARRTLGRFFQDEIARPLGIEFYFGVPETVPDERIAQVKAYRRAQVLLHIGPMPAAMLLGFTRRTSLTYRAFGNPALRGPADLNRPEFRAVEIPAATGVGEARAVARVYGDLATGGDALEMDERTMAELTAPPIQPSGGSTDLVLRVEAAFSLGFLKPSPLFRFGSSDRAFGHTGAGGAFGFAPPHTGPGLAFAPHPPRVPLPGGPPGKAVPDPR